MPVLILGLILFLGPHSLHMLAPRWRDGMVGRIGLMRWKGLYSLVAIAGFVLIIVGFGTARHAPVVLYAPPASLRHANALFTLVAFVLIAAAYAPRNQLKTRIGHPMLGGVAIWAFGHLLATGFVHDTVLFGTFLAWSVADSVVSRRRDRTAGSAPVPGTAAASIAVIAIGVVAWAIFAFLLHRPLIGVDPFA